MSPPYLPGEPEDPFAQDVAEYLGGAAHDRVRRCVAEGACGARAEPVGRAPQQRVRAEHARAEGRELLLELRPERLGRGRESLWCLLQRLPQDEQPADAIAHL